jgi:hypothetical protein
MKIGIVLLAVALAAPRLARAQPAPAAPPPGPPAAPAAGPGMKLVSGQAPVVGGNAVGARERALDDAIRQAVELTIADIVDPAARAAQAKTIKTLLARARSYVPRYRTLEEGETNGLYAVRLEAEVDELALRRKLEPAGPVATGAGRAAPLGVAVVPGDGQPGSTAFAAALVGALASAGVKARAGDAASAPASGQALARVTATASNEGEARGTGRIAVACQGGVQLSALPGAPASEERATARVFVVAGAGADADGGRQDCFGRLSSDLAARVAGKLGAGGAASAGGAGGDLRLVTVDAEVGEAAAVPALVRSLRSVGAVSSAELTRVAAGRAEVRLRARAATSAIAAAIPRAAGTTITLTDVEVAGDVIRLRAQLRAPVAPAPGTTQGMNP